MADLLLAEDPYVLIGKTIPGVHPAAPITAALKASSTSRSPASPIGRFPDLTRRPQLVSSQHVALPVKCSSGSGRRSTPRSSRWSPTGVGPAGATRLDETLLTGGPGTKSAFNRLKKTAPRPSWTNFRQQIDQVLWVDAFGDSRAWWQGVALSKITDFAGEGASGDAAVLGDYGAAKRTAVLAAMVHAAQEKARDDTAAVAAG